MNFRQIAAGCLLLGIGIGIGIGSSVTQVALHAQSAPSKVGFVNVDALFKAHPLGKQLEAIQAGANKELEPLSKQRQALLAKGNTLTPKEKQDLETVTALLTAAQKKWSDQSSKVAGPLNNDVNRFIEVAARSNGFSVLMDATVAANGLVIYAEDGTTNLTETVLRAMAPK